MWDLYAYINIEKHGRKKTVGGWLGYREKQQKSYVMSMVYEKTFTSKVRRCWGVYGILKMRLFYFEIESSFLQLYLILSPAMMS